MSVMPTSGVPHGLRSRRKRAWLCRLQNQTGRPVSGWRLIGDWAFCTACSRIGRPSAPQSISRSMSNFGATAPSTSSPSLVMASRRCASGSDCRKLKSRLETEMRTCDRRGWE